MMQDIIFLKIANLLDEADKRKAIKEIQDFVYNDDNFLQLDQRIQDVLGEFAHDLDFFEPDPTLRLDDPSYYDEGRLGEEIKKVVGKLDALQGK